MIILKFKRKANNFADWGSRDQWMRDVAIKGTKANVTFHNIVDNEIEKRTLKSAEISQPQGKEAGLPLSVFSKAQLESNHFVALIARLLIAEIPIFLSTAGPTTKGPMPIANSLNFTEAYFVAKQ